MQIYIFYYTCRSIHVLNLKWWCFEALKCISPSTLYPSRTTKSNTQAKMRWRHEFTHDAHTSTSGGVVLKWKENNHAKRGRASEFIRQQMRGDSGKKWHIMEQLCLCLVLTCNSFESPTKTITDIFLEQRRGRMFWRMVLWTVSKAQDASHKESKFWPV